MATWYDRVLVTTTTTGTGTLTLGSAVTGYASLSGVANGTTLKYALEAVDANGVPTGVWEVGTGTAGGSGTTLARTTVEANSSGTTSPLSLAAGTKRVMVTPTAAWLASCLRDASAFDAAGAATTALATAEAYTDAAVQYLPASRVNAFSFTDNTSATSNTLTTSDTVTLSGPTGVADVWPVTADGAAGSPQVQVNGGSWSDGRDPAIQARSGDTLAVRLTAGASLATRTATVRVGGRSTVWTVTSAAFGPGDLTGLVATLLPALSRSQGKLWQDASKTVPANANNDPVRVAVCPFTAVEWTAPSDAARPLLKDEGSGKWSLALDGVDDYLTTPGSGLGGQPQYLAARQRVIGADMGYALWTQGTNDPKSFLPLGGTDIYEAFGTTTRRGPITASLSLTVARTYEVVATSAAWQCWLDAVSQASYGSNTLTSWASTVYFGTNLRFAPWSGRISGLLLASAAPDSVTRASAESYLASLL